MLMSFQEKKNPLEGEDQSVQTLLFSQNDERMSPDSFLIIQAM